MKIRKAKKEDWNSYSNLKKKDFLEYGKLLGTTIKYSEKESKEEFYRILKSETNHLFLVEDKFNLVGFIHGVLDKNSFGKKGIIEYIFVEKNYRGKGLATKMIKKFVLLLKKENVKNLLLKVNLNNKNAIKLYEKLGFEITNYVMRKKLK